MWKDSTGDRIWKEIMFDLKDYDLIALDIDGTVTDSKKRVTDKTKEVLAKAISEGKNVVLASGRPEPGVAIIAKEIGLNEEGGYMLCYNGGRIVDCTNGNVLLSKEVENKYLKDIFTACRKYGAVALTYEGEDVISWDPEDEYAQIECRINKIGYKKIEDLENYIKWNVPKVLIVGEHSKLTPVEAELKEKFGTELSIYFSESYFLEVMAPGVDKAEMLGALAESLGSNIDRVLAFGDGLNDVKMLAECGYSVCMENGCPEAKEAADHVTLSNDNEGIYEFLNKYM